MFRFDEADNVIALIAPVQSQQSPEECVRTEDKASHDQKIRYAVRMGK